MLVIFGIAQRGLDALDGAALALVMFVLGLFVVPAMMILGFLMGMRSARRKQIAWLSAEGCPPTGSPPARAYSGA